MAGEQDEVSDVTANTMNDSIHLIEVKKACEAAKLNKAVGVDDVANELLKNPVVMELLAKLFNLCFEHSMIPDSWRQTIVHPIPKEKGICYEPLKYRGIALQCCICEILCNILNCRIVKNLEDCENIVDCQNGFRKQRSCLHHIFSLLSITNGKINAQKGEIFGAFVDF